MAVVVAAAVESLADRSAYTSTSLDSKKNNKILTRRKTKSLTLACNLLGFSTIFFSSSRNTTMMGIKNENDKKRRTVSRGRDKKKRCKNETQKLILRKKNTF